MDLLKVYFSDSVFGCLGFMLTAVFVLWLLERFFSVRIFLYSSKNIKVSFCVIIFILSLLTLFEPSKSFVNPEFGIVFDQWARTSRFVIFGSMVLVLVGLDNNSKRSWEQATGSSPLVELFLLLALLFGASVLVSCVNLILLIVFFEIVSLLMFILGLRTSAKAMTAAEAFVKYILSSGVSSGFVYLGIYFILCGSFLAVGIHIWKDAVAFMRMDLYDSEMWMLLTVDMMKGDADFMFSILLKMLGVIFVLCGFAFKFGLAPFHFWMADLYQGLSSYGLGLFMSIPKLALFLTLIRFNSLYTLQSIFMHLGLHYLFTGFGILSVILGSILMVRQYDIKRLLAFSSIHNFGYIFLALGTNTTYGLAAALHFFYIYIVVVISFLVVINSARLFLGENALVYDLRVLIPSLWKLNKSLSFIFFMFLFIFLGLPPAFNFFLKVDVISCVLRGDSIFGYLLGIIALFFSVFSVFVYLHLVTECLFKYSSRSLDLPFIEHFGACWYEHLLLIGVIMVGFYFSFIWCFFGYGFVVKWILFYVFS